VLVATNEKTILLGPVLGISHDTDILDGQYVVQAEL
jgi:hypothetical protein